MRCKSKATFLWKLHLKYKIICEQHGGSIVQTGKHQFLKAYDESDFLRSKCWVSPLKKTQHFG